MRGRYRQSEQWTAWLSVRRCQRGGPQRAVNILIVHNGGCSSTTVVFASPVADRQTRGGKPQHVKGNGQARWALGENVYKWGLHESKVTVVGKGRGDNRHYIGSQGGPMDRQF